MLVYPLKLDLVDSPFEGAFEGKRGGKIVSFKCRAERLQVL